MIVADASIVAQALLVGGAATERIANEKLIAPALIDAEVLGTFRKGVFTKVIAVDDAEAALVDYQDIHIIRIPMPALMDRAWELRENVTPYDAMYVALAEWFELPLVTMDARLAGASGIKTSVEVVPVG